MLDHEFYRIVNEQPPPTAWDRSRDLAGDLVGPAVFLAACLLLVIIWPPLAIADLAAAVRRWWRRRRLGAGRRER